jgi:arsenate reductase-like glutaredoxin family protein
VLESKKKLFPYLSSEEQSEYVKSYRENLMDDISDDDVKLAIAKEYNAYKKDNPDVDVISLLDKMKKITDKQQLIKRIDEDANYLVDAVK